MGKIDNMEVSRMGLESTLVAKIEGLVKKMMREHHVPSIGISIVKGGVAEYSNVFGVIDVETQQAVTPESVYLMMSIAKQFVATAIMQLVEKNKIDPNASVTEYLTYFKLADPRYKDITIQQLLSHTSGMPSIDMPSLIGWWREAVVEEDDTSAERYVRGLDEVSLLSEPGEDFAYSDIAFDILGQVITEVSDQGFEDYMHKHIFAPLGMKNTTFLLADIPPELLVQPHVLDEANNAVKADVFPYTRWHAPSTNLFSNVLDMTYWMLANLNGGKLEQPRILNKSSYEQLWAEHTPTGWMRDYFGPSCSAYGYGWFLGELNGYRVISHFGADLGFHASVLLVPDANLGITAMGNCFYSFDNPANFYMLDLTAHAMKILLGVEDEN